MTNLGKRTAAVREGVDRTRDLADQLARGRPAVETQIERHLVVARSTRVKGRARGRDFRQSPFDGRVNVLVGLEEHKRIRVELTLDPAQSPFN